MRFDLPMAAWVGTRSFLLAAAVGGAMLATSFDARAMGAIVTSPAGASTTTEVRVAVSSTGTRTSRWASIRVHGDATTFAWVIPVKTDAFADLASDAWLESLAEATVPRVVPPDRSPPCGPGGVEVEGSLAHDVTTPPDAAVVAADDAALASTLSGWGLSLTSDLATLVAEAGTQGDAFLVLRYTNAPPDVVTRTVRIVDTSPATIALGLTQGSSPVDVTAYAFTRGGASVGASALVLEPSLVLWLADGTSTYAAVRDTLLMSSPGGWLVETAGQGPIFGGETGAVAVPALVPTYFALASGYGDAASTESSCTASADTVSTSSSSVALACPPGTLAKAAEASCEGIVESGVIAPDTLRCGGIADDLALALSGLTPAGAWLTRARSVVAQATFGADAPVVPGAAVAPEGPVVTCAGYDDTCGGANAGAGTPPGGGTTGSTSSSGSGGANGGSSNPGGGGGVGSAVGSVAGAALDSSSDGCGGNSSDDGSGDSCGGDTSGSDDSSGGGDCSGSSASSSDDCRLAAQGSGGSQSKKRAPTSRALLALVALAALARRRTRLPGK